MEVCEQLVNHAEVVAGEKEDFRFGAAGGNQISLPCSGRAGRGIFEGTDDGCADGEDGAGF